MKSNMESGQGKSGEQSVNYQPEFNFELWAKQVRPQLLASLQKRGMK
jgi:hypothetical protein